MKCPVCASERLSPLAELQSAETWRDRLQLRFDRPGFFQSRPTFYADYARACRDCGLVLPFLGERGRRELDAAADALADVDGSGPAPDGLG